MQNKLHWNSYTTPFFLPIDEVDKVLADGKEVKTIMPSMVDLENYLKVPLKCNLCNCAIKNIPALKIHQKQVHGITSSYE